MATLPIGVQLFSLRDDLTRDFEGTMRRVADIGYTAVELYSYDNYWGRSAADLRKVLEGIGLQPVSCHLDPNLLQTDPETAIAFAHDVGCRFAGFPYLAPEQRGDASVYRALGQTLTRCGGIAQRYGMSFFYHNHDFEFAKLDGAYALDVLLAASDPDLVASELDVYWVQHAGLDPAEYIRKLGRRCQLVHLKDMAPDAEHSFAEIGEGIMDLDAVVAAGQDVGVQWYIVEQDCAYHRTPLEAIALSMQNMKRMGWA